jgi:DNA-binding transcriptional LysR family regulator
MDRYTGMAIFVKVVEGSSFAGAARYFRISPAVVSKHVQAIEQRLGVRLLNRTTRRVTPTEVGQSYYLNCVRILADLEEAERTAGDHNSTPRGLLKVSAPYTFGIAHVAPAMADYLALHPDVSIELVLNDRFVDLVDEGFDVSIRIGQLPDSTLIARKLVDTQTVLCASPLYLEQHGEPRLPSDLAGHNCLIYPLAGSRGEWRFFDSSGVEEAVQVSGRFVANSGDALRVLGLKGQGVVRLPLFIASDDLAAGRLVRLLPNYETIKTPVHALYPHGQFLSAKVRSFVDFLAARFAKASARRPEDADAASIRRARHLRIA